MNPAPIVPASSAGGLLTFLLASAAVIALAALASRWLGAWHNRPDRGRRMKVLEGVPMGKERSLLLVAVGKEVLVVGASPGGVNLHLQFWQDQQVLVKTDAVLREGSPLFIGGPKWRDGQLIFVLMLTKPES